MTQFLTSANNSSDDSSRNYGSYLLIGIGPDDKRSVSHLSTNYTLVTGKETMSNMNVLEKRDASCANGSVLLTSNLGNSSPDMELEHLRYEMSLNNRQNLLGVVHIVRRHVV